LPAEPPVKSIFAFCREECHELGIEDRHGREFRLWPAHCPQEGCPLFHYRLGHNPRRAGIGGRSHH